MFSTRARDAMRRRGGFSAPVVFVRESCRDSLAAFRAYRAVALGAVRIALVCAAATAGAGALLYINDGDVVGGLEFAAWTLAGGAATAAFAAGNSSLFRRSGGELGERLGLANALTIIRFVLVAPVTVFLLDALYAAAIVVYAVLVLTDVADGVIARARREASEFGVVMDPLADIVSTFAVFTVFWIDNLVPLWLYLLLAARYAMLVAGSSLLFLATGPIDFRATAAGKVVGVVQAAGAVVVMVCARRGGDWLDTVGPALFPFLGFGFASIVVSQTVLGWRHIVQRRAGERGSRR